MKISLNILILGLTLFLNRGLMATEQPHPLHSQQWITVKNGETGLLVDFPHEPLETTFEMPFQNTPPKGQIHIYSVPTPKGLLALSTFHSSTHHADKLSKQQLLQFFETVLVPHFFFNPSIFQDHQTFNFESIELEGKEAASFQFSFRDHGVVKKLEGIAVINAQMLYIPFYLASEKDFDQKVFTRFLNSVQIPTDR